MASRGGGNQYPALVRKNFPPANRRDYSLYLLVRTISCPNFAASDSCELFLCIGEMTFRVHDDLIKSAEYHYNSRVHKYTYLYKLRNTFQSLEIGFSFFF